MSRTKNPYQQQFIWDEMNFLYKMDFDYQEATTSPNVGTLLGIAKEEFVYSGYYGHGHRL
jgi:hypothetical protein